MICLLSVLKTKNLVIALLLLGYASTGVVPSTYSTKKQLFRGFGSNTIVNPSDSYHLPFSAPLSNDTEQEPSDNENNFSQEDENFIGFPSISISPTLDSRHIHYLNNPPSPGSLIPPFSPPDISA